MTTTLVWPERLPAGLGGLVDGLAARMEGSVVAAPPSAPGRPWSEGALVAVLDESDPDSDTADEGLDLVTALLEGDHIDVVVVVGDSHLGSDAPDLRPARAAAAAVALIRSKATRRGTGSRANAVCVPSSLLGNPASQRGPLAHRTDGEDVADAVAFLLDADNAYLHGQVLHVTGGRQLFSSATA